MRKYRERVIEREGKRLTDTRVKVFTNRKERKGVGEDESINIDVFEEKSSKN